MKWGFRMITGISLFIFIAMLFGIIYIITIISDTIASVISKRHRFETAFIIVIFLVCMILGILSEYAGSGICHESI